MFYQCSYSYSLWAGGGTPGQKFPPYLWAGPLSLSRPPGLLIFQDWTFGRQDWICGLLGYTFRIAWSPRVDVEVIVGVQKDPKSRLVAKNVFWKSAKNTATVDKNQCSGLPGRHRKLWKRSRKLVRGQHLKMCFWRTCFSDVVTFVGCLDAILWPSGVFLGPLKNQKTPPKSNSAAQGPALGPQEGPASLLGTIFCEFGMIVCWYLSYTCMLGGFWYCWGWLQESK